MQSLSSSPYFSLRETLHGGRSIFANTAIATNTLIHISNSPYASVIFKEFRKEVCAWCFAYDGRKGWKLTVQDGGRDRFCGAPCAESWSKKEEGIRAEVIQAIAAAISRKRKIITHQRSGELVSDSADVLHISQETLDVAWENAQRHSIGDNIQLDDMEIEIARFVASAIVSHHARGHAIEDPIMSLQPNELPHNIERPYILPTHIRIYQFLRAALFAIPETKQLFEGNRGGSFIREVLSRDAGNSFGIWEETLGDEGTGEREMFGWGIWVDASLFNHNCAPNIKKTRIGRTLHFTTTRPIFEGEELCISYVNTTDDVAERRKHLKEKWFFLCACERCTRENGAASGGENHT